MPECSARRRAAIREREAAKPRYGRLPGEAEVLDRIRDLWHEGCGYLTIAKELNRDGVRTRYNGKWHPPGIKRLLVEMGLETPAPVLTEAQAREAVSRALAAVVEYYSQRAA
jgi:hypothetical protein